MLKIGASKTFDFDKVAWYGGRKVNKPTVTLKLSYKDGDENKPVLSISANIWNAKQTDIVCGGQCLDEMMKYRSLRDNETFKKLYHLWSNYHLNDMHSGTVNQEKAVKEFYNTNKNKQAHTLHTGYNEVCDYLKSVNLYVDNGYVYGTSWLYRAIPEDDLNMIKSLLELN